MDIKNTPVGELPNALGPIKPAPSLIKLTENTRGGPIKVMLYKLVSVHTNTSCLDFRPPTIREPLDNLTSPALFVLNGSNSKAFSESLKAISIGSTAPVLALPLIGSAPNTIKCLSVSDVMTCKPTVGTRLAPDVPDRLTALVDRPSFSTHL